MTILIKRYPNRKLYDTAARRYIALDGIGELIRQGNELQIVDNVTGEDLTAVVLSQVILENEKKQGGFLPHALLSNLIQSGGQTISTVRRELLSSLDALKTVDDEIRRRFDLLVEAGDLTAEQAQAFVHKLTAAVQQKGEPVSAVEKGLQTVLGRGGIATRSEIENLTRQIDELSAKLDQLVGDAKHKNGPEE